MSKTKERLIQILTNSHIIADYDTFEAIADILIANGVTVPGCEKEERYGKWVSFLDGDHIMPERYYRCSLCGRVETRKEPSCHCGAKMR